VTTVSVLYSCSATPLCRIEWVKGYGLCKAFQSSAALVKWLTSTFNYKVLLRPNINLVQRKFLTHEICQQTMERNYYVTKSGFVCL